MIRLFIGLRILRGPRRNSSARTPPGSIKRRALLGICCVLVASAATHSGAGRAARADAIPNARARIAHQSQRPSALFLTPTKTHRSLRHVDGVNLAIGSKRH
jgi:hypothetical protein